jgi:hypothetical protein
MADTTFPIEEIHPADAAGLALLERSLADLANGIWQPDPAELAAATDAARSPQLKSRLANLLTHYHFTRNELDAALAACHVWLEHGPDEVAAKDSLVSILVRQRRFGDVIAAAQPRLEAEPENFKLRSALCNASWRLGDEEAARAFGNAALELQDRVTQGSEPTVLSGVVAPFDPAAKSRNIIAFSLYGSIAKYLDGAIRNAVVAASLYPEWTCRFYVDDSVPKAATARLAHEGAQLRKVDGLPAARFGTFWRFLVADDPEVDRFLLRDSDSCVSLRERAAVEDWIQSGKPFHVMRDGFAHTELVLAGMWGGVRGVLPPLLPALIDFSQSAPFSRTADQAFLRERVWPTMRGQTLIHDSCFTVGGAVDFPQRSNIAGQRVGEAPERPGMA